MITRADRIASQLTRAFAPLRLAVEDESSLHAGHAGASAGGQTHYRVTMVSASFSGQNRVARTRRVNQVLEAEFATGLHALSLSLRTPAEDAPPGAVPPADRPA